MNLIDLYTGHLAAEEKSPETLAQYGGELRRFERWLIESYQLTLSSEHISSINGLMLTEYCQHLYSRKLRISTRNNYVVILKEFFEFLMSTNTIREDPSNVLHCVKEKKKPVSQEKKLYSLEQIDTFLSSMSGVRLRCNDLRDTAISALILGSGLRASEACSLNISDLEGIRQGMIHCMRKGGDCEEVNIAEFVYEHIARYLLHRGKCSPNDPLFLSRKGNRMTRTSLWKSFANKQRRVKMATGIHKFRHKFLSDVDHNGGAALARDLGGHNSIVVTDNYLHTTPEERKEAVNRMSYAELFQK